MQGRHKDPNKRALTPARWKARGFCQEMRPGLRLVWRWIPEHSRRRASTTWPCQPEQSATPPSNHQAPPVRGDRNPRLRELPIARLFLVSAPTATITRVLIAAYTRALYAKDPSVLDLDASVYALDATTIDLCLSLFDWAPFRATKAAIKLHTLLDLRGAIPAFIHISDGKLHDVNVLDILPVEAGAFYVMDRGYVDFERLYAMHQAGACPRRRETGSNPPT